MEQIVHPVASVIPALPRKGDPEHLCANAKPRPG